MLSNEKRFTNHYRPMSDTSCIYSRLIMI